MRNWTNPQATNAIDRVLQSAVCSNWKELSTNSSPMAMRLEYRIGSKRSLEHLKLWSSTSRGYWKLVCEYAIQTDTAHRRGITFTEPNCSPGLARMLDAIMHHQEVFSPVRAALDDGLVQIAAPDAAQFAGAKRHIVEALVRITSRKFLGDVNTAMRFAADHPSMPTSISSRSIS